MNSQQNNNNSNKQHQRSFYSTSEEKLQSPTRISEGTKILITSAGTAANERRERQKSIMNCLRDRTPSYSRSNSHIARANGGIQQQPPFQRLQKHQNEMQPQKPRPIKLTLLKSSSTRDLNRLLETQDFIDSNTDLSKITSSSASISTSSSASSSAGGNCSPKCLRYIQQLEQRITHMERQLNRQNQNYNELNQNFQELQKKMDNVTKNLVEAQNKRKKTSMRLPTKKETTNGTPTVTQTVVQPSKLVAWMKLSNFWKQRPSIQTLKDQNIYSDEPCFDTEIEMVLKDDVHKTVPRIVVDCCQLIEDKYRKSTDPIEGIYRQCGDYNKMQALRFSIDANNYEALRQSNVDIHTLAGVLKLFLREIKSPLISENEAKTFIGKPNQWVLSDLPSKLETLRRLIRSLPEVNRDTMEYLFAHFNRLTKVPLQHISAETLAISITPSIFHTVQQGARMQDIHTLLKESEILSDCVKIMIEYYQKIFECTANHKNNKNRISVRNLKKTLSHPDLLFQNLF